MDISDFNTHIKSLIPHFAFEYSSFTDGDFGDLQRVGFEGCGLLGTVDFWSRGWVAIDLYDTVAQEQRMNRLLSPEDESAWHTVFNELAGLLGSQPPRQTCSGNA